MADMKQIVRIINSDILGEKNLYIALTSIPGVGSSLSSSICNVMRLEQSKKVGTLSSEEVKKIEDILKNPLNHSIPPHLLNRRRDPDTGEDIHVISSDLRLSKEFDIKKFKKIKSYKGIRHAQGLPVRGQKTRSNFRKGKAVGVSKKSSKKGKKG